MFKLPLSLEDEMRVEKIYAPSLLKSPGRRLLSFQSLRQKSGRGTLYTKQDMGLPQPSDLRYLRYQPSGRRYRETHLGLLPYLRPKQEQVLKSEWERRDYQTNCY